eukprot:scaffold6610_cov245-Pinguiococcus_pyrenoidosus.AAC.6
MPPFFCSFCSFCRILVLRLHSRLSSEETGQTTRRWHEEEARSGWATKTKGEINSKDFWRTRGK